MSQIRCEGSSMRPIVLNAHTRPLTAICYNQDGDLLFTAGKDGMAALWWADSGEMIGTYEKHGGAVNDIAPSWDSRFVLTACYDGNAYLFAALSGEMLAKIPKNGRIKSVAWADGGRRFAVAFDPLHREDELGTIGIFEFCDQMADELLEAARAGEAPAELTADQEIPLGIYDSVTAMQWVALNGLIVASMEDGRLLVYDTERLVPRQQIQLHEAAITSISFTKNKKLFVTSSKDKTAKLVDLRSMEVLKTFTTERPVNAAVISPLHPHVLLGGGQSAHEVTVTAGDQGHFETRFFHLVYEEEFGRLKGHFGPINALAMHPDGHSFVSGGEDGLVRIHHFDSAYINMNNQIILPDEEEEGEYADEDAPAPAPSAADEYDEQDGDEESKPV